MLGWLEHWTSAVLLCCPSSLVSKGIAIPSLLVSAGIALPSVPIVGKRVGFVYFFLFKKG